MNLVFMCSGGRSELALATRLVASAKRIMSDINIIQLSDLQTEQAPGTNCCIRADVQGFGCMHFRVELYNAFAQHKMTENTVFADIDMLITRDLRNIFDESFDVGLTWRIPPGGVADQHFNGGVLFIANTSPGKTFMNRVCERVRSYSPDKRHWWGDQIALTEVVGEENFLKRSSDTITVDDMRIRFFPCETHNFVPETADNIDVDGKYIVHFKGGLKQDMARAYEQLCQAPAS